MRQGQNFQLLSESRWTMEHITNTQYVTQVLTYLSQHD